MPLIINDQRDKMKMNFPNLVPHNTFEDLLKTINPRQVITKDSPEDGTTIKTWSITEEKEEEKKPLIIEVEVSNNTGIYCQSCHQDNRNILTDNQGTTVCLTCGRSPYSSYQPVYLLEKPVYGLKRQETFYDLPDPEVYAEQITKAASNLRFDN
jgi:hypothetical protein